MEYLAKTFRLRAGNVDEDLTRFVNTYAAQGWTVTFLGEGVSTREAGGVLALDRLVLFSRKAADTELLETVK